MTHTFETHANGFEPADSKVTVLIPTEYLHRLFDCLNACVIKLEAGQAIKPDSVEAQQVAQMNANLSIFMREHDCHPDL